MNDAEIRQNFHRKILRRQHIQNDTLVIDELGLNHGVKAYSAVFDRAFIVAGDRHIDKIQNSVPEFWGVIISSRGPKGAINFNMIRRAQVNRSIDPVSMARLLWRDEAIEILRQKKLSSRALRQPRAVLYNHLAELLNIRELRKTVREHLKNRRNWRCPESLS
jgi:hypothetical protein